MYNELITRGELRPVRRPSHLAREMKLTSIGIRNVSISSGLKENPIIAMLVMCV